MPEFKTRRVGNAQAVVRCRDKGPAVTVPAQIGGQEIAVIGTHAFRKQEGLEEIVISEGILYILQNAFEGCAHLAKIQFPDTMQDIGPYAFKDSGLREVILPEKLTRIEIGTFETCMELRDVQMGDCVEKIGRDAFRGCGNLRTLRLSANLREIVDRAFSLCISLEEVRLPDTVESIGKQAFYGCGMHTLHLSERLTEIPEEAFAYCGNLEEVILPRGVKTLGKKAFDQTTALRRIYIPPSVRSFGEDLFGEDPSDFTILCEEDSLARKYAWARQIPYEIV